MSVTVSPMQISAWSILQFKQQQITSTILVGYLFPVPFLVVSTSAGGQDEGGVGAGSPAAIPILHLPAFLEKFPYSFPVSKQYIIKVLGLISGCFAVQRRDCFVMSPHKGRIFELRLFDDNMGHKYVPMPTKG